MKLETLRISKKYGSRDVVKQVSLEISRGEIVGLLGPNGAGKTTFFNAIVGLVRPNSCFNNNFLESGVHEFNKDFVSLMPTNLYGPHDNFDLETSHVIP